MMSHFRGDQNCHFMYKETEKVSPKQEKKRVR